MYQRALPCCGKALLEFKLNKILGFCFIFFCLSFFSCKSETDSYAYSNTAVVKDVRVIASSRDNCISFSRTLMPGAWNSDDLDFYIYGKKKNGADETAVACTQVSFEPSDETGTSGIFFHEFEKAVYDLYLAAVPKGKNFNNAQLYVNTVLLGIASVDLNYAEKIVFYLSATNLDSVENAYGGVSLYLYSEDWNISDYSGYTVSVGIYNQTTGAIVKDTALKTIALPVYYTDGETGELPPASYDAEIYPPNYVCGDISPGMYNFIVNFTNGTKSYCYNTTVRLYASQTIQSLVSVPNVIALPPKAPSDFVVGYQDPTSESEDSFYLEFDWTDNSNNEAYFQLEILNLSSVGIEDGDASILSFLNRDVETSNIYWNNYLNNRGASVSIFKDSDLEDKLKIDGSLVLNSNYVVVREPLGTCSVARLCAVNDEGKSDYVYADIFGGTSFRSSVCSAQAWSSNSRFINRLKVSYNLSVGNFYDDESDTLVSEAILPAYYTNAVSNGVSPLYAGGFYAANPISMTYANGLKTATLRYYDEASDAFFEWKAWQNGSVEFADSDSVLTTLYKDFRNIVFFAVFDGSYEIGDDVIHSYCSCDANFDADIYVTLDNTNDYTYFNYGADYFVPVCSNSSDCHFSDSCSCPTSFVVSKATSSYIHILCKNGLSDGFYNYDDIALAVSRNGYFSDLTYSSQNVGMTLGTKPATNFTHYIVSVADLDSGDYTAMLTFKKSVSTVYYILHFSIND